MFRETDGRCPTSTAITSRSTSPISPGRIARLMERGLVTEESNQYQYRFRDIVDLDSGKHLFTIEHEVRSITHPMYPRPLVNRNPRRPTATIPWATTAGCRNWRTPTSATSAARCARSATRKPPAGRSPPTEFFAGTAPLRGAHHHQMSATEWRGPSHDHALYSTWSVQTLKLDQRVGAEGVRDRHVGGVAALADQDAADARHVVARVEGVPAAAEIGLEPAGEIHRRVGRRHADVAEIAGAIARRDVHAAAEGDGEMGEVAAHARCLR